MIGGSTVNSEYKSKVADIKEKAAKLRFSEPLKVIEELELLKKMAEKEKDAYNEAFAYMYIADAQLTVGDFEAYRIGIFKTYELLKDTDYNDLIASCYNFIAIYYIYSGDRIMAVENLINCAVYAAKNSDYLLQGKVYNNLASLYVDVSDYETAIKYLKIAYKFYVKADAENKVATKEFVNYHMNMALCCDRTGQIEEAIQHIKYVEENTEKNAVCQYGIGIETVTISILYHTGREAEAVEKIKNIASLSDEEYNKIEFFANFIDVINICIQMKLFEEGYRLLYILEEKYGSDVCRERAILGCFIELCEACGHGDDCPKTYERFYEISKKAGLEEKAVRIAAINSRMELLYENLKYREFLLQNNRLSELSEKDELTGAYNRYGFRRISSSILRMAAGKGQNIVLFEMDIDYFKHYNDTYGHPAGDECLKEVTNTLLEVCGERVTVFRYGGDEFFMLGFGMKANEAGEIAEKICSSVKAKQIKFDYNPQGVVTVSLGVVCCEPKYGEGMSEIIHYADTALYEQKKAGRGGYSLHEYTGIIKQAGGADD